MKIFRPIRSNLKTQGFGESRACVRVNPATKQPYRPFQVRGKKESCEMGWTDFYKVIGMKGHNGEDLKSWNGEPLYFPVEADCKWYARNEVDFDGGVGLDIFSDRPIEVSDIPYRGSLDLIQKELDKYEGKVYVKFRFWHLEKSLMKDGEEVKFGQMIAKCDNTGASSGSHLHWSWKVIQPAGKAGFTLDNDNGFYGGQSFGEMYENRFCLDVLAEKLRAQIKEVQLSLIDLLKKVISDLQIQIQKLLRK